MSQAKKKGDGKRCVVGGCTNCTQRGWSVYKWPTSDRTSHRWSKFVGLTRADWKQSDYASPHVCSGHFTLDCFSNYNQWVNGFASRLYLHDEAVPTLRVADSTVFEKKKKRAASPTEAGSSSSGERPMEFVSGTTQSTKRSRTQHKLDIGRLMLEHDNQQREEAEAKLPKSIAIQTDPPTGRSVGIQTSTRPTHKAVQASVKTRDLGFTTSPSLTTSWTQCNEESEPLPQPEPEESNDPDFIPPKPKVTSQTEVDAGERKYIVFRSKLLALFSLCFLCREPSEVSIKEEGSCATFKQTCTVCPHTKEWQTQPYVRQMPLGNLLLSGAILISGCVVSKALRLFEYLNVAVVSRSTYFRHQHKYLYPHIISSWKAQEATLHTEAAALEDGLVLEGDARCDSPGHCAKFGAYTVIEATMNKILSFSSLQCNEVQSSYHMELEGLKRVIEKLGALKIKTIVTDRHRSIAKYIREELQQVMHLFDVWHVAKGVMKKIDAATKKSGCEVLSKWKQSINNHLYWCAASTPEGQGDLIVAKWRSVMDHVCNKHKNFKEHPEFTKCAHGKLPKRKWLKSGSTAYEALENIILSPSLLRDIKQLSGSAQTSHLESFHSLLLLFAPKHTAYSFLGMQARISLTAAHYNSNSTKPVACSSDGTKRYRVTFPKVKKGRPTVKPIKTKTSYEYAKKMLMELITRYRDNPKELQSSIDDIQVPPPLSETMVEEEMDKADIISGYVSRFNQQSI